MNDTIQQRADLKSKWSGVLEFPYISKLHRNLLDGFKVSRLSPAISGLNIRSLLDVGSGWGEYSRLMAENPSVFNRNPPKVGFYVGFDNSLARVSFAQKHCRDAHFVLADAVSFPFKDGSFDAVLLANTSHHLTDEEFLMGLNEMKRVSRRYIIVDDSVRTENQGAFSRLLYALDRGTMFRFPEQLRQLVLKCPGLKIIKEGMFSTFPGCYVHSFFILEIDA